MWETVRYGDVDYYEDRRALDALIAAVPPEMHFLLSKKRTTKEAWDVITVARIGSDRTRKTTLQTLHKEWENLTFKSGGDVDDFALHLNTLLQKMVQFSDDTYDEERKPLRSSSVASPRSTTKSLARSSLYWTSPRCQSKRR
jgi:hypothetical protein